jgi:hypothetical protein
MKKCSIAVLAVLTAGCGSGGGEDTVAAPSTTAPPPAAQAPSPAPSPATSPANSPPPRALVPAPVAPSPAPALTPPPPVAGEPDPVEPEPTLLGKHFAAMMNYVTERGPQPLFRATNDPDGTIYGNIFASQAIDRPSVYNYQYTTAAGGCTMIHLACPRVNPNWAYKTLVVKAASAVSFGAFASSERIETFVDDGVNQGSDRVIDLYKVGGYVIAPDARLPMNATIAQWNADPYFVQLQTGFYRNFVRNCWHVNLPGVKRQACMLFENPPTDDSPIVYRGEYITDDSNPGHSPVLFIDLP